MPTKTWTAKWKGHAIEVENWWWVGLVFNRHRCRLFIDGKCEDELSGKGILFAGQGTFHAVLRAQIVDEHKGTSPVRVEMRAELIHVHMSISVGDECVLSEKSLPWGG